MSLKDIEIQPVYRSQENDLLKDFYLEVLKETKVYRTAVGFFSAQLLAHAAQGLSTFVKNDGIFKLIVGSPLSDDEYQAVKRGETDQVLKTQQNLLLDILEMEVDEIIKQRFNILAWLISQNRMEIKIVFKRKGMFHEKFGIMEDNEANSIVFVGSANATAAAFLNEYNIENLLIFKSWDEAIFQQYGSEFTDGFDKLWENDSDDDTIVVEVPSAFYQSFIDSLPPDYSPAPNIENEYLDRYFSNKQQRNVPEFPKKIGDSNYCLLEHQRQAILAWNDKMRGILKLATGAGKTITACHTITALYKANDENRLFIVIAVPYQNLADQWVKELKLFNIIPVRAYQSKRIWYYKLKNKIRDFNEGLSRFECIVVVNKTLRDNPDFKELISKVNNKNIIFIADECHHFMSDNLLKAIPKEVAIMGLSATPYDESYEELYEYYQQQTEKLKKIFGDVVAEYPLEYAIDDGVLCNYDYHIVLCYFSHSEFEQYSELTKKIGAYANNKKNMKQMDSLMFAILERSKLVGGIEDKFNKLEEITSKAHNPEPHTLVYCGGGRMPEDEYGEDKYEFEKQIDNISNLLIKSGWKCSKFTANESGSDRNRILDSFKRKSIDTLVAIRVLDEGIDIPACQRAYILASSTNSRQYIQRRGRILRKSKDKEKSTIYDFVALPPKSKTTETAQSLVKSELKRIEEFRKLSLNRMDLENSINEIKTRYNIT
jgi:superfamily II DNA or RNA helicase